jgi:YVTN family beta-propeller protein
LAALLLVPLLVTGCAKKGFPHYAANFREYAYVTNGGSNTVTVLDVLNLRQDRVIPVGQDPVDVAVSPTRNEVYVVNAGAPGANGSLSVIDAQTNQVAASIPLQRTPRFIDVGPAGERAYVTNSGSNTVTVLDLKQRKPVAVVPVGSGPDEARISPDGNTLVVTNRKAGSVTIIDPHTLKVRSTFTGCPQASDTAILPDSSKAFVACTGGRYVMAIALARHPTRNHPHRQTRPDVELAMLEVGQTPTHLALKPDGGEIFVSNFGSDTISEIDTSTNEVGGAYLVGAHPAYGVVGNDDSTLWVSNYNADTIGVYSIDDGKLVHTVQVGNGPTALAFSSDDFWLFAVDASSGDVTVVRTLAYTPSGAPIAGEMFTILPAGRDPNSIAIKTFLAQ